MASNIISVSATGLNEILASLIAMQNAMKGVTQAAKVMQNQINQGANPSGGNSNGAGGNGGASERVRREANTSSQALRDNARRESMAFVAAYAEIASSVFALTAAFNALKSVAQFDVLLKAQSSFAKNTGINLKTLAKVLQETTAYALDFQQAAQFSSIGRLAGFSTKQITQLAEAGRAAATILGRDVPEALSRMFRGVSKGEPEILDELGIFIRLDRAYKEYVATIAKGQKVLDLTAWQRTQATHYAAIKAAKQTTEGNANAKIDDFTTSAAIITTTIKTAMISITNILGPTVKFLTQNTGLLVSAMLLLGGKALSNLGNILVNVTAAKTAASAIAAQRTENRAFIQENKSKLITQQQVSDLISKSNSAKLAVIAAEKQMVKDYVKMEQQKTNKLLAQGRITQAEANSRRYAQKFMLRPENQSIAAERARGAATTTTGPLPNTVLSARQQALNASAARAATLSTQAASAATASLAAQTARVNNISITTFGRMSAMANVAAGSINGLKLAMLSLAASVKVVFIGAMSALASLAGFAAIGYMVYQGGKALLDYLGAFGSGIEDLNEQLKASRKNLKETFNQMKELPKLKLGSGLTGAIIDAKKFTNILDSTSADLGITLKKLKEAKDGPMSSVDTKDLIPSITTYNSLLNAQGKQLHLNAVKASELAEIEAERNRLKASGNLNDFNDSILTRKAIEIEKKLATWKSYIEGGAIASVSAKSVAKGLEATVAPLEAANLAASKWSASLSSIDNIFYTLGKNYTALVNTMKAESIFNTIAEDSRTARVEIAGAIKAFNETMALKNVGSESYAGATKQAIESSISFSKYLGGKPFQRDDTKSHIENAAAARIYLQESLKLAEQLERNNTSIRNTDVQRTNTLNKKKTEIDTITSSYSRQGLEVANMTNLLSDYLTKASLVKETRLKLVSMNVNKQFEDDSTNGVQIANRDATYKLSTDEVAAKAAKTSLLNYINDINASKTALGIPLIDIDNLKNANALLKAINADVTLSAAQRKKIIDNLNLAKFNKDIQESSAPLADYTDLLSALKDAGKEFKDDSLIQALMNKAALARENNIAIDPDDAAKAAISYMSVLKGIEKSFNYSKAILTNFDFSSTKTSIIADEMRTSTDNALSLASELKSIFSGINLDVASKIASMETKLKEAAITSADNATQSIINNLSSKPDLIDNRYTNKFSDANVEEVRQALIAKKLAALSFTDNSDEVLAAEIRLAKATQNLTLAMRTSAISQAGSLNILESEIQSLTKDAKEARWSSLMKESAREVVNAWQDAKDAISKGLGKDGGSLSSVLSNSLKAANQGILDIITTSIAKKQDSAFSLLENKSKQYLFGIKDDKGNKLPGALDRIGESFKGFRNDMTTKFPKTIGTLSKGFSSIGGLETLKGILSKNEAQRNSAIGGALGSVAGTAIGTAFTAIGGPLGGAIGSVVGNIIGNTFGKKLKETGFEVTVSKTGEVFANELQVFKKTTLTGTKTINNIIGKLDSESAIALQQAISGTRDTYVSSLLQYNKLTAGAFNLSLDKFRNFSYSGRFVQQAGGNKDSNELLKNFVTDYGNKMGEADFSFLYQFRMATESIVDVLKRLVATIRTTETAFHTMFGNTFKGPAITAKEYIGSYTSDTDNYEGIGKDVNNSITAYDAAHRKEKRKSRLKKIVGGAIGLATAGLLGPGTILGAIGASTSLGTASILGAVGTKALGSPQTNGDKGVTAGNALSTGIADIQALLAGGKASHTGLVLQGLQDFIAKNAGIIKISEDSKAKLDTLALMEKALKDTTDTASMEKVLQIARADYYSNMVAAFDGANAAEKEANYNKALSTYTGVVAAGVTAFSNSYSGMVDSLSAVDTEKLPDNISAVRNNLILPIQEYNKALQLAVETEASPTKIAEAIKLGAKLAEVIQSILDVFSSINISEANNAASFSASVVSGIGDTFKQSVIENFKKSLLAPLLADAVAAIGTADSSSNITYKSSLDAAGYALGGDIAVKSAKDMLSVLSDKGFTDSLASVSAQFERLISTFDKLDTSKAIVALDKALVDIAKTLKESAYSFAVTGDSYSVSIFKAREAFKAAGLSSDLASEPISSVVAKMKAMASSGSLTTKSLDSINEALNAMADVSIAARDQIQATVDASQSSIDTANNFMISLTKSIIDDSGSIEAAKASLSSILTLSASKVDKAREEYSRAKASGNLLAANQAAENLTTSLEAYVNAEIDANNTLKSMAEDRYNAEKSALDNLKSVIEDIVNFLKDIKFDDKLSILKPVDRLTEAAMGFDALRAKVFLGASNGNLTPEALKSLQEDSKRLLDLGREVYASGDKYTELYNSVTTAMLLAQGKTEAEVLTFEASTKMYQDMALSFAKDTRDIQLEALKQLQLLSKASAVDNAVAIDMVNALKYNAGMSDAVTLSDYYKKLFSDAQGGGTIFTQPEVGYTDFNGIGTYDETNKATQEANTAKLNQVLDTLTVVLQNLPVNVKSAIQSTATTTTNRN